MSGFVKNDWNRFLNGGTSQYNFSYRSETPASLEPIPAPTPVPSAPPATAHLASPSKVNIASPSMDRKKTNKVNKVVIPTIKGGKRKTRRNRRRYSRRK